MPELVFGKEERSHKIQLESVENSAARRLVKENYVAGLEIVSDFAQPDHAVVLVPEATAFHPASSPRRIPLLHEIIWS
jgi:hypothetical protein